MTAFWETTEWIEAKTAQFTTEKTLSRVQFLKLVGSGNYSEEAYNKYLTAMKRKESENDSIQEMAD